MEQINERGMTMTLVHFVHRRGVADPLPENDGEQPWRVACLPNMVELHQTGYHPNYQRTDDPRAVSCPACKNTEAYKRAVGVYHK